MTQRLQLVDQAAQYVGEYLSKDWVMTNIFRFNKEEAKAMSEQMKAEIASGEIDPDAEQEEGE